MSGYNDTITCPKCQTVQKAYGKAMTLAMTCAKCQVYFRPGTWNTDIETFTVRTAKTALAIGSKGKVDGWVYRVMGFVVKEDASYHFQWREYLLFNPYQGYAFLSEYNGHWNFIWPIETNGDTPSRGNRHWTIDDTRYDLYQKSRARVIYASGEFFFDVVAMTASTETREFIYPPTLYGIEESDDSLLWFQGEYLTRTEVASAFNIDINTLPTKEGIGYTEPRGNKVLTSMLFPVTVVVALVALIMQLAFSNLAQEKIVFQGDFKTQNLKEQKVFVSPAFALEGTKKNLEVEIFVPLDNDWFFGEFSLIDEATGDEHNFTKEIEYYSGVDSEGSWSEGSHTGTALLSKVPAGRYHLNIYPDLSSGHHQTLTVAVRRDVSSISNFLIILVLLAAYPIIYYYRRNQIERKRWEDSDYSPYAISDEN